MSIVLTNNGDQIVVGFEYPITHIDSLNTVDTSGIEKTNNSSEYLIEFCYSLDLIHYSDWEEVNDTNIQAIPVKKEYDVDMRFRITKTSEDSDDIIFNYINVEVDFADVTDVLQNTVFTILDFEDYTYFSNWCKNVLRKLYEPGIVPIFLERGDGVTDRDYIDFWRAVSCYWSLFVVYARRFESLQKIDILKRILESRGIFFHENSDKEKLRSTLENSWNIYEIRGTLVGTLIPTSSTGSKEKLNELLNLMNKTEECGSIVHYSPPEFHSQGLVLDKSSYLSRYIYDQRQVSLFNIDSQPLWFIDCLIDKEENTVEFVDGDSEIQTDFLRVNNGVDYELTFLVKESTPGGSLKVEFEQFNPSEISVSFDEDPYLEFEAPIQDKYYFVRIIIFGKDTEYFPETSIGSGTNGRMSGEGCLLKLNISIGSKGTGGYTLKNIDFKILETQYQKASIQGTGLIDVFIKDKSKRKNVLETINEFLVNQDRVVLLNEIE